MKTEREKMLAGEEYLPTCQQLQSLRQRAKALVMKYNLEPKDEILEQLFKAKFKNLVIEPPFFCDYGENIEFGENVFMNYNCVILDCAKVKIGSNCFFGPHVQLYTACHPIEIEKRNALIETAKPITIGNNCWIGGNSVILAGVEIGDNVTIGASSVVTKSIGPNCVAVGNPCRVIKKI